MEMKTDAANILLDGKCKGSRSEFRFRSLDEVLESGLLRGGTREEPKTLYVAPGIYWLHDPKEDRGELSLNERGLPCEKFVHFDWLTIKGLSEEPGKVVFAARRGQSMGCVGNYTMFSFEGKGLMVQNITFGNYCNVDLALSCPKRSDVITQAQIASFNGEFLRAENCRFVSRLNLMPICGAERSHYINCHFECTDDSLNGHAIYENCDFDFYGGCPFWKTDRAGVIFIGGTFRVHTRKLQFAKHEGQMAFIGCDFSFEEPLRSSSGIVNEKLHIYEKGNTQGGKGFSLSQLALRADDLPEEFLDWEKPVNLKIMASADSLSYGGEMELCGSLISFYGKEILEETVYFEAYPKAGQIKDAGFYEFDRTGGRQYRICNCNEGREVLELIIRAHTADGLKDEMTLKLLPQIQEAPSFEECPKVRWEEGGLRVLYRLNIPKEQDNSLIVWYRLPKDGAFGNDGGNLAETVVARGRGVEAARYFPDMDDMGYFLAAEVCAAGKYGEMGAAFRTAGFSMPKKDIINWGIKETDFRFAPLEHREGKGVFLFHAYTPSPEEMPPEWRKRDGLLPEHPWKYGRLGGGCVGEGIFPMQQGSGISYIPIGALPSREELPQPPRAVVCSRTEADLFAGNMRAEVMVDTAKTAGQGFGSAGQYMDIILRFAPGEQMPGMSHELAVGSGLAVRVKRTTRASDGVEFMLVKYENGISACLTEPVIVSCFQTGCRILAEADGSGFRAEISCNMPQSDEQKRKGWLHRARLAVDLPQNGTISMTQFSGFCLLHTGTCGDNGWFNTIMLHKIRIEYF